MTDPAVPSSSAGFTLIELLVALLLFALISLAGLSLVETMVRLERSSAGRLERLADIQRALFLVGSDFEQLVDGPDRTAAGITLKRLAGDGPHDVLYRADQAGLHRVVDGKDQLLLGGISHVDWRFAKHGGWTGYPRSRADAARPAAVELTLQVTGGSGGAGGPVRIVIELPAEP